MMFLVTFLTQFLEIVVFVWYLITLRNQWGHYIGRTEWSVVYFINLVHSCSFPDNCDGTLWWIQSKKLVNFYLGFTLLHVGVFYIEEPSPLGFDAVLLDKQFTTLQKVMVPSLWNMCLQRWRHCDSSVHIPEYRCAAVSAGSLSAFHRGL
jgi:hypothetical protein